MKKLLVTTLLLLTASAAGREAHAARKVALLTSVDGVAMAQATPSVFFWLKQRYASMDQRLEKVVREHFAGSGIEVEALSYVDVANLYQVLHSPEYEAVFWVSHGADSTGERTTQNGGLYDYQTFDISPLFAEVNPRIRLLALVSCQSGSTIQELRTQGELAIGHPGLELLTFDGKIDEAAGLRAALERSTPWLAHEPPNADLAECSLEKPGYFVSLARHCVKAGPSLYVRANDRLVTVFSHCEAGESQLEGGFIPLSAQDLRSLTRLDPATFDVTVSSGSQPIDRVMGATEPYFGELAISHPGDARATWKLLESRPGVASGVDRRVFTYSGSAPASFEVTGFHSFFCQ